MPINIASQAAPRPRRIAKSIAAFVILVVGLILLPTLAFMQSGDGLPTDDTKQDLSPQVNSRPDILWMRGGHQSASDGLAYAQNGQILLSVADSVIKIFRTSDGVLLRSIAAPGAFPGGNIGVGFAVSIDGQRVAVGTAVGSDYAIKIYSISDGSLLLSIPTGFFPGSLSFSPVNNQIVAAGSIAYGDRDTNAGVWDSNNGNLIRFLNYFPGSDRVGGSIAFSPNGQEIAANARVGSGEAVISFNASTGAHM